MKHLIAVFVLFVATCAFGQTPLPNAPTPQPGPASDGTMYFAGLTYNNGASPALAGTGLAAKKITDTGTYAVLVADILPATIKPFVVTTNIGVGVAQRFATFGNVPVYATTSAGLSTSGINTGWSFTGGVAAVIEPKPGSKFRIMPGFRFVKSSVSGGTGYQIVPSVLIGLGSPN